MTTPTLKGLRESNHLTKEQVASHFSVKDTKTITNWESGQHAPKEAKYRKLWIEFLLNNLNLRRDQGCFFDIWQTHVIKHWRWEQITEQEAHHFRLTPPPTIQLAVPSANSRPKINSELTTRQHAVMQLLVQGKSSREIAHSLHLTPKQVEHMLTNQEGDSRSIYAKLGVNKNTEAIIVYQQRYPTQTIKTDYFTIVYTMLFCCLAVFVYVPVWVTLEETSFFNYYSGIYALLPASAGIYLLLQLRNEKIIRCAPFYLLRLLMGIALLAWATGGVVWMILNVEGVDVPYPSQADFGFAPYYVLVPIALYLFARANGWQHQPARFAKLITGLHVLALLVLVALLLHIRHGTLSHPKDPGKFILDVLYPALDLVALHQMMQLAYETTVDPPLRYRLRWIHAGLGILFTTDSLFSLTTSLPEHHTFFYYNGGQIDFLYVLAFYIIGYSLVKIQSPPYLRLKLHNAYLRLLLAYSFHSFRKLYRFALTLWSMLF